MPADFETALSFTLLWEGGYSLNPADPGGETKYGISKRAHPGVDIAALTVEQARDIYRANYWDPIIACGILPSCRLVAFDTAVNVGLARAKKWAGEARGWRDIIIRRQDFYLRLAAAGKGTTFLRGWANRTMALVQLAEGADEQDS